MIHASCRRTARGCFAFVASAFVLLGSARGAADVGGEVPAVPGPSDWSWDPAVLAVLLAMLAVYVRGVRALWRRAGVGRGIRRRHVMAFGGSLSVLVVALLSPLDTVGTLVFSGHMVQHLLLTSVAAPLLVLGRPAVALSWGLPRAVVRGWQRSVGLRKALTPLSQPAPALIAYAGVTWAWHAPLLYESALRDPAAHLAEHASFWLSSVLFWWVVLGALRPCTTRHGAAILLAFSGAVQGGVLGALITISPTSWYAEHAEGALVFGMTPLEDQQLAGLLMWVPGGLAHLLAALGVTQSCLHARESALEAHPGLAANARHRKEMA